MTVLNNKNKDLEKAIKETVAFFDIFSFPPSEEEIFRFLKKKYSFFEVITILEQPDFLLQKHGYFFLPGRFELPRIRQSRYNESDKKMKKALKIANLLKNIGSIKMIAIGNLIGTHNLRANSDIDFFIITKNNQIWSSRFWAIFLLKILRQRPSGKNKKDKICLSFFASEDSLDLKNLRLDDNDIYFTYWLAGLTPIYDPDNYYDRLIKNNSWLKDKLPNWHQTSLSPRYRISQKPNRFFSFLFESFLNKLENFYKKWQLKIMPKEIKDLMNQDSGVVVNDQVLKLFVNDRRSEYREIYLKKIKEINENGN